MNKVILVSLLSALSMPAFALSGTTADPCEVDTNMAATAKAAADRSEAQYATEDEVVTAAPKVKDASCLPTLDALDGLIRAQIPGFGGGGGLLTKVKDAACKFADGAIKTIAGKAKYSVGDPYGIASVGIGATTDGESGIKKEEYDVTEVIERTATGVVRGVGGEIRSEATGAMRDIPRGPIDRKPAVNGAIKDAGQGVTDAIKGL